MKSKYIIIVTILLSSIYGCSRIEFYNVYDQCQPPYERGVYVGQCDSGSFELHIANTMSLRMTGPPLIPFFPVHPDNPKHIYIFVHPRSDTLFQVPDAPEFALRPQSSNVLINPQRVYQRGEHNYSYGCFFFNIGQYSPDTLEVIFLTKYNGCDLPPVTFIASKKTEYEPFEFPG